MKTYCGSGGIAPLTLNLGIRWRWMGSFTTNHFTLGERAPCTNWNRSGCGGL